MKIAYVVGTPDTPSERFIAREVSALKEQNIEVIVYSVASSGGFVCPWCVLGKHAWLSVLPRTWRAVSRFPFGDLAALRGGAWKEFVGGLDLAGRHARDMRAKGVEHVHAHFLTKPAAVGAMAAAMLRVPLTLSAHARDVFTDGVALRRKVASATGVAVCNRAALDVLRSKLPLRLHDRLALIRHGLDAAAFPFTERRDVGNPMRVLAAGRLVEKKGFGVLIDAMAELADCTCEIAGEGPLEAVLRERVRQRGLGDRVHLVGWLGPEELRSRMEEADVLVVPSVVAADGDRDGVPNVLIEAAALGVPLVACDAGGVGEFVVDGETGRLVPPGDAAALSAAVRRVRTEREATLRLCRSARNKVEKEHDLRENTRQLANLFTRPQQDPP